MFGKPEQAGGGWWRWRLAALGAAVAGLALVGVASLVQDPSLSWLSGDEQVQAANRWDTLANDSSLLVKANKVWEKGYNGAGVGVAVVDTGISATDPYVFMGPDGNSRIVAQVSVNRSARSTRDGYGHGTHVAGIVAGDDSLSTGQYVGIAPGANLVNVKVADDRGNSSLADVIAGLEYVYDNRFTYNIRVVNLSLTSSVAQSYQVDPLDAAVEFLWFNGIFVVSAAGNLGTAPDAVGYAPANDPFVLSVGTVDDGATKTRHDDVPTTWSSSGITQDGFSKPELLAPGRGIVSAVDTSSYLYNTYSSGIVKTNFFRLSGTSMSAGVMSGVAALVLQRHPDWAPGQLKCVLIDTSKDLTKPYKQFSVVNAEKASNRDKPKCNADAGVAPSTILGPVLKAGVVNYVLGAPDPNAAALQIGFDLGAAGVAGANLSNVDWSAIKWSSIKWSSIKWSAIEWSSIKWSSIKWSSIKWSDVDPSGIDFTSIKWSSLNWSGMQWDAIKWSDIQWSAVGLDSVGWTDVNWTMFRTRVQWTVFFGDTGS